MPRIASKFTIRGTREDDTIFFKRGLDGAFVYSVNTVETSVSENLVAAGVVINGNSGNDNLTGWTGDDELNGGRGNDTLTGLGGYDFLSGGAGNDTLIDDWLGGFFDGGVGLDTLDLSHSDATRGVGLDLGTGNVFPRFAIVSYVFGEVNVISEGPGVGPTQLARISGVENVVGSAGADFLSGSGLANRIEGGAGRDIINGQDGNDSLFGGADDDQIHGGGGAGDDEINGGPGNDQLDGGPGRDRFTYAPGDDGNDFIFNFNKSEDTIEWSGTGTIVWSKNGAGDVVGTFPGDLTSFVLVGITDEVGVVVNYFG